MIKGSTFSHDPLADVPFHLSHSGHGAITHLRPRVESPGHSGYDPNVSASVLDLIETDSEAAGSDGFLHPAGEAWPMQALQFDLKSQ